MATIDHSFLSKIGFNEKDLFNLRKNETLIKKLHDLIVISNIPVLENTNDTTYNASCGPLLLKLIQSFPNEEIKPESFLITITKYILLNKLKTGIQVEEAISFVKKEGIINDSNKLNDPNVIKSFEEQTGIGLNLSNETVSELIKNYFINKGSNLPDNLGKCIGQIRNEVKVLKFVDGNVLKQLVEEQYKIYGSSAKSSSSTNNAPKKEEKKKEETTTNVPVKKEKTYSFEARFLESAVNSKELLEKHRKETGGKVMTRFPPEPNGFLHIGHAKAMNLSFGYANQEGGYTYLRYDDTNPEKEEKIYFDSIKEMVEWLGFKPFKITYTSDYFKEMYDFAIQLIKEGKAYVDFSSKQEIHEMRENKVESKYRNTSVEENLREFEKMKMGMYDEGHCVLRCKIDMKSDNYNMRDFIAYRIKYAVHPHAGDEWCIYPTYDFSHCIVDSLENITHSLCTLEFEVRRDSYYWLLQALNLYRPHVYEFSRLNITNSLLSKRKVLLLVKRGIIRSWDDPRVLTLAGLRRRGYTPEAIKSFCDDIGVTRNENVIPIERLEQSLRVDLDERCNRVFAVLDPLKITLKNVADDFIEYVEAKNHPKLEERGSRKLPFTKVLYIERSDFRLKDDSDYYGLAPNKEVGLRYANCNIRCEEVIFEENGKDIKELICTADFEKRTKPKTYIHWLAQPKHGVEPMRAEVRLYEKLFTVDELKEVGDDWMNFINLQSEKVMPNALIDPIFEDKQYRELYSKYQFERLGFFVVDKDSTDDKLVFNRSVTLKVDPKLKDLLKK